MQEIFPGVPLVYLIPLMAWSLFWKGIALWRAARSSEKVWFVVLLIASTAGILELIYIFFFSKKKEIQKMQ